MKTHLSEALALGYKALAYVIFICTNVPAFCQTPFQTHIVDNQTHGCGGIYAIDLDKDSDNDILAASLEDNQIIWFRNEGGTPITWTKIIIGNNVANAHSVIASDIDNDTDLDVIGAAYMGAPGIAWWRNDGGNPIQWTKFPVAEYFINAHEIFADDIDKDNDIDVLGASSDLNRIAWWRNDGGDTIHWTGQIIDNTVALAKSVRSGDLDGDGKVDVIGASITNNDVIWWKNNGGVPINWTKYFVDANFIGAHRVQAVDIDNDTDLDIVGAGYIGNIISWWRNDGGNPLEWHRQDIETNFMTACIAYAIDIDKDQDIDILGTSQGLGQVAMWLNRGGNPIIWTKVVIDSNFYRVWPLYAIDLDGDSDIDVIGGSSHQGNNQIRWWENLMTIHVGNNSGNQPESFKLYPNFPNPFNPVTTIEFDVPHKSHVRIDIFNIIGQRIKTIVDESRMPGSHSIVWEGTDDYLKPVASGIYFYRLTSGDFYKSKKMVLVK